MKPICNIKFFVFRINPNGSKCRSTILQAAESFQVTEPSVNMLVKFGALSHRSKSCPILMIQSPKSRWYDKQSYAAPKILLTSFSSTFTGKARCMLSSRIFPQLNLFTKNLTSSWMFLLCFKQSEILFKRDLSNANQQRPQFHLKPFNMPFLCRFLRHSSKNHFFCQDYQLVQFIMVLILKFYAGFENILCV